MENLLQYTLFQSMTQLQVQELLKHLQAKKFKYKKGETIIAAEQHVTKLGIITSGRAFVKREDADGEVAIIAEILPGDVFAEAIVCAKVEKSPVSVSAYESTTVLWLDIRAILSSKNMLPNYLVPFYLNLLFIISQKNIYLNQKIRYLNFKTTRLKVVNYLFDYYNIDKCKIFIINFNRNQLAEYLGIDRSSLSRELGKLQKEGLLDFKKNTFVLKDKFFQALDET